MGRVGGTNPSLLVPAAISSISRVPSALAEPPIPEQHYNLTIALIPFVCLSAHLLALLAI